MNQSTRKLHYALIRLLRGALAAWEDWVKAQSQKDEVNT